MPNLKMRRHHEGVHSIIGTKSGSRQLLLRLDVVSAPATVNYAVSAGRKVGFND